MMAHDMHVFPSTRRRRRSSSGGVRMGGVSAAFVAVCCSTLMLQVLTTTAPATESTTAARGASELFDALLARVSSSVRSSLAGKSVGDGDDAVSMRLDDMRVSNVSVHRVRYVANDDTSSSTVNNDGENEKDSEQDGATGDSDRSGWNGSRPEAQGGKTESFMGRWTRKVGLLTSKRKRTEVTSVVVTWDDSFRSISTEESDTTNKKSSIASGRVVTYELQHWVNGWGFDALWHPSNRKLTVADPFVVLSNLPQEHEIAFRVRMKVKKTTGLLLSGLFATETDGPWSPVALLSPSRDDALEAIFVFLASNKAFFLVLLMCIGSGSLVLFKLLVSHRFFWLKRVDASNSALATTSASYPVKSRTSGSRSSAAAAAGSGGELEQEIEDLRQELADSEAEVHKLMLFRGYGVERLSPAELAIVEQELRVTLQRIQKLQKLKKNAPQTSRNSSEEDTDEDDSVEPQQQQQRRGSSTMSSKASGSEIGGAYARRRRLGAVFEADETSY